VPQAVITFRTVSRLVLGRVSPWVWVAVALLVTPALVAAAVQRGVLELVAVGVAGIAGIVLTIARPRLVLFTYVALIPLEPLLIVGAGTIPRAVAAVFFAGYLLRTLGRLKFEVVPAAGWAYLVWAVASILWAVDPSASMEQVVTLVQLFAIMLVVADLTVDDPPIVRDVLFVFTASATLTAMVAIAAALVGGSIVGERLGAFENQDVAQFAALLVPAFFFVLVEILDRKRVVLAGGALAIVSGAILLSGTRSAWVAIGVGFAFAVLPRLGARRLVPLSIFLIAAVALFAVDDLRTAIVDRLSTALSSGGAGRIDIWTVGMNIFTAHPLAGVGYGSFPAAFTPEIIRDTDIPGLDVNVLDPGAGPHSLVIGTLAELGIVGMVLLAAFLVTTLRGPGLRAVTALHATVIALLTQSLFLDVMNRKHLWLMIALVLGLSLRIALDRRADPATVVDEPSELAERIRRTWSTEH
jgi:O-antigen ligase